MRSGSRRRKKRKLLLKNKRRGNKFKVRNLGLNSNFVTIRLFQSKIKNKKRHTTITICNEMSPGCFTQSARGKTKNDGE
jgi:hypothetical protein